MAQNQHEQKEEEQKDTKVQRGGKIQFLGNHKADGHKDLFVEILSAISLNRNILVQMEQIKQDQFKCMLHLNLRYQWKLEKHGYNHLKL